MGTLNKALWRWLEDSTPDQARQLAKLAKTSVPHLRHIAYGRRNASAELAQRLAHSSTRILAAPPPLDQRLLCDACGNCQLAKAADKK